jgi:hypothetical protein
MRKKLQRKGKEIEILEAGVNSLVDKVPVIGAKAREIERHRTIANDWVRETCVTH